VAAGRGLAGCCRVEDTDKRRVGGAFSDVISEPALGSYSGFHTVGLPTAASAFGVYRPRSYLRSQVARCPADLL
jgi:hypothetical protein